MRTLEAVLADHDLGHLRIVAEWWGLELEARNAKDARVELAEAMLAPAAQEIAESLPAEARQALDALMTAPGARLPYAALARQFGEIREMGPGRRDREKPWRSPAGATETLWYRGLVGRAFDDSPQGPQEFIFVPEDLRAWLPEPIVKPGAGDSLGSPFGPVDPSPASLASTAIVDDACTLLAYLQSRPVKPSGPGLPESARAALRPFLLQPEALDLALHLLVELGLLDARTLKLDAARVRPFLEADRARQLAALAGAWRASETWNDLFHVPGLKPEGVGWKNAPRVAREEILNLLVRVPRGEWWSLPSFVAGVKGARPDFQRPAADYESWYIRDARTGGYLRGFEHWDQVDGALVAHLITGPLHWLGATDLGGESPSNPPAAFRLTRFSPAAITFPDAPELRVPEPAARLRVGSTGRVTVPRAVSRYDRFQVARFSDWTGLQDEAYQYRLSPASLAQAGRQGIRLQNVLAFLRKSSGAPLPRPLEAALARVEQRGAEAKAQRMTVLRVKSADVLEKLRASPKTRRFLGEALGELAVEVKPGDWQQLADAAAELGVLVDGESP